MDTNGGSSRGPWAPGGSAKGVALWAGIGMIFGAAFGDVAIGLVAGAALGVILGVSSKGSA